MMVIIQEMQKNDAALIERLTAHVAELQENRQKLINTHIEVVTHLRGVFAHEKAQLEARLLQLMADNDAKATVIKYTKTVITELDLQIRGIE